MAVNFPTEVPKLGPTTIESPLPYDGWVSPDERVLYNSTLAELDRSGPVGFERAGPRRALYFDPVQVKAAIVTCGGLCPGLNDVIRAITLQLHHMYGVRRIVGARYGYAGLNPKNKLPFVQLTPQRVRTLHEDGGTTLGSSRGPQPVDVIVDTLVREDIRVLFTIGGDGTLRGALAIADEIERRGLNIGVIGVPKTIDNDISLCSRTFGFSTAVTAATDALRCAHAEAEGARNGVGVVKLMGRHSGYVAANAALAQPDANFVLVPEVPFDFDGPNGLLTHLERRVRDRGHALVVVAEGAGQDLFGSDLGCDPSGNKKLGDIGTLLSRRVTEHLTAVGMEPTVKYIDPSYIIRSVPANPEDSIFCVLLGQNAAHAAMAGCTKALVSSWNNQFTYVPIAAAIQKRKSVDPMGMLWRTVLQATGQPASMKNG